jgi:hypothetical protein
MGKVGHWSGRGYAGRFGARILGSFSDFATREAA